MINLRIDFGASNLSNCVKCGEPIDVIGYIAWKNEYKNNMCLKCLTAKIKEGSE